MHVTALITTSVLKRIPIFALALALAAQQSPLEERAIALAGRLPVSTLEAGLPRQTLVQWLTRAVGPNAKIQWGVNDCGEYSGDPNSDRGRDFPLCVDAAANLHGGRKATVSVVMGTFGKGIVGRPQLLFVYISDSDGGVSHVDRIPKLRDLPARIKVANQKQ